VGVSLNVRVNQCVMVLVQVYVGVCVEVRVGVITTKPAPFKACTG
jgi:hypothetical protein